MILPLAHTLLILYFPIACAAAWYDHRCRKIPRWLIVPPFYAALVYFVWWLWQGSPSYGIEWSADGLRIVTAIGHLPNYSLAVAISALIMIVLYVAAVLPFRGSHLIGGADARVLITIGLLTPAVSIGRVGCIPTLSLILLATLALIRLFPLADPSIRADWKERGIPGLIPVCASLLLLLIALW